MENDDWDREVEEFEKTKGGVKGLVDSGITKIPRFFVSQPEPTNVNPPLGAEIPIIDFEGAERGGAGRARVVEEIRNASQKWGFFQIINHGVPRSVMEGMLKGTRSVHEQPKEEKMGLYTADGREDVRFYTINGRLNQGDAVSWRDVFACNFVDGKLHPHRIPPVCRNEINDYMKEIAKVRDILSELLSEALGLSTELLEQMQCMESAYLTCLYYPASPEPDKSLGTVPHSDPTLLTLLVQDNCGGLQIKHGDSWINVPPMPDALIVNIGDFLQLMSNDKFTSVEHRVLSRAEGSRVSVACFFYPRGDQMTNIFGPIKQVVSQNTPPVYTQVNYLDFLTHFQTRSARTAPSPLDKYKLVNIS